MIPADRENKRFIIYFESVRMRAEVAKNILCNYIKYSFHDNIF